MHIRKTLKLSVILAILSASLALGCQPDVAELASVTPEAAEALHIPTSTPVPEPTVEEECLEPVRSETEWMGQMIPQYSCVPQISVDPAKTYYATIKVTNESGESYAGHPVGDIKIELLASVAPLTVSSFKFLAEDGFYDGLIFHRVIPDFMIQGGDPTGTGTSGPGYKFKDEFEQNTTFDRTGILAMANSGPGTNGSQFFITVAPTPHLNFNHTIFGYIVEGQELADEISIATGDQSNRPTESIIIETIIIDEG